MLVRHLTRSGLPGGSPGDRGTGGGAIQDSPASFDPGSAADVAGGSQSLCDAAPRRGGSPGKGGK